MSEFILSTKKYILENLVSDVKIDLTSETSLIGGGYIDSITTLQLVDFLEKEFNIEFDAHEVDRDNLDTLNLIEAFVKSKQTNG